MTNLLNLKDNTLVYWIDLTPQEALVLSYYVRNDYIADNEVIEKAKLGNSQTLKTCICRISAKTNLKFDRKTNYGYKLRNLVLINY